VESEEPTTGQGLFDNCTAHLPKNTCKAKTIGVINLVKASASEVKGKTDYRSVRSEIQRVIERAERSKECNFEAKAV